MRCPKCQYISFDNGERCRNCGYQFSFSTDEPQIDVTIGRDEPRSGRVGDISLADLDPPLSPNRAAPAVERDGDPGPFGDQRRPITAADLPLFTDRIADDQAPLVTPPAVPRQPLSVRRTNPGVRPRPRHPLPDDLSLDLAAGPDGIEPADLRERPAGEDDEPIAGTAAGIARRFGAGLIDLSILGAIDGGVVYLTLRACELAPGQWPLLPLMPLGAFLLLLCGGYFVLFTAAGGQTVGKMATRIRVVAAPAGGGDGIPRVSFGTALVRAVASLGSVLALGAGFVPIWFSADRRAFHDRVAETRVVVA
jgi:uncharacterized RDD family membrane protein YckC